MKWGSERERACAADGRQKWWRKVIPEGEEPGEKTSRQREGLNKEG